jgi:predicted alpha/beta-fold hydrolase
MSTQFQQLQGSRSERRMPSHAPQHRPSIARVGPQARRHGRIVTSGFEPHPMLRNAHLQTMLPELLREPEIDIRHERLELPDGDFVDLGWSGEGTGPIAILVHGIAGSFRSHYVRGMARTLTARGWRTVILQLRGSGAEPNRLARCYHHGDTEDFHALCQLLREREPSTPLCAIGWSLGANIVLKALGEARHRSVLAAGAAVSAPFRLEACALHLKRGAARIYQAMMLKHMKRILHAKHALANVPMPQGADLGRVLKATNFVDLCDAYTAPMTGFRGVVDYCAQMECGRYLHAIRTPALVLHALDDPFMEPSIVPTERELSPQVRLELSTHGGHVGFIGAGPYGQPQFWLEQRIPDFLDRTLGHVPVASAQPQERLATPA